MFTVKQLKLNPSTPSFDSGLHFTFSNSTEIEVRFFGKVFFYLEHQKFEQVARKFSFSGQRLKISRPLIVSRIRRFVQKKDSFELFSLQARIQVDLRHPE